LWTLLYTVGLALYVWLPSPIKENQWGMRHWSFWRTWVMTQPLVVDGPNKGFQLDDEDPTRKYVVTIHPHGLYPLAVWSYFGLGDTFAPLKACIHSLLPRIPLGKEIAAGFGCIEARYDVMARALHEGRGLIVLPGGNREGLLTPKGTILRRSRPAGCVRMAVDEGADVIPVYDASVDDMYTFWLPLGDFFYRFCGFPWPVVTKGRGWLSLAPKDIPMRLVIGNPISTAGKTAEQVENERIEALEQLKKDYA
jgi:hypothetical protein